MVSTVQEALRIYKSHVREYMIWIRHMQEKYGAGSSPTVAGWGNDDYSDALGKFLACQAMEKVLDLSQEEIDRITEEVRASISEAGIKT